MRTCTKGTFVNQKRYCYKGTLWRSMHAYLYKVDPGPAVDPGLPVDQGPAGTWARWHNQQETCPCPTQAVSWYQLQLYNLLCWKFGQGIETSKLRTSFSARVGDISALGTLASPEFWKALPLPPRAWARQHTCLPSSCETSSTTTMSRCA